jgi:hypothetical protein
VAEGEGTKPEKVDKPEKLDRPEIGLEYGMSPVTPGGTWEAWATSSADGTISNNPVVTIDQLVEMRRRDGQAKALVQLVTLPLRLALQAGEWIEPEDGGATKEAEFANQMWTLPPTGGGMTTPQAKLVRQMLLAITDGFAAFEIVRHIPKEGPLKGKITIRKLAYRDPRTIRFKVDKNGGYAGFRQVTHDGEGNIIDVTLKPSKTLTITQHDELNPYYGVSLFESAYPHFDAKRKLYYIAHLAAQFAAVPGRIGEIPHSARVGEVNAFRVALQNFAFNASMLVPPGYTVTPFNGNTNFDFLKLIDHHNQQMSKSILASFFDQEQRAVLIENTTGTDAAADLFLSNIETIANDIAEAMTHYLMPQFINLNFSSKKYPIFKPGKLSDHAKAAISEMFKTVVVSGILNSTPEFVRELEKKVSEDLGLDIDYEAIEEQEKVAAQEKADMEAEQAELQAEAQVLGAQQKGPGGPEAGGGPGGPPPPPGAPASPPGPPGGLVAASGSDLDNLVLQAQELFMMGNNLLRSEEELPPVDEGV